MSAGRICLLGIILFASLVIVIAGLEPVLVLSQGSSKNEIPDYQLGENIMFSSDGAQVLVPCINQTNTTVALKSMSVAGGSITTYFTYNVSLGDIRAVYIGYDSILYDGVNAEGAYVVKIAYPGQTTDEVVAYNHKLVTGNVNPLVQFAGNNEAYVLLYNKEESDDTANIYVYEVWKVYPQPYTEVFKVKFYTPYKIIKSFYYDPDSNTTFLSIYNPSASTGEIYEYNSQNPSGVSVYSVQDGGYVSGLVMLNGKLYGVLVGLGGVIDYLVEYDIAQGTSSTIQITPPITPEESMEYVENDDDAYAFVLKEIGGKIVLAANLERYVNGNLDYCYYVGVSYYDPVTGQAVFWGRVNLTEINETTGIQVSNLRWSRKDVIASGDGGYMVALAWSKESSSVVVVTDVPQYTGGGGGEQPPPPPEKPPEEQMFYHMEKLCSFGGPTSSYTVLDYHAVNETFGYITASSAAVENKVILENTRGIAVVSVNFTGAEGQPVNATMLVDNRGLMIPYGSVLVGDSRDSILFYGSSLTGESGFLALYNVTTNITLSQKFSEYRPFVHHLFLVQYSPESEQGSEWLVLVEANGTLVNVTFQDTGIVLKRLWSLENLSDWNSNATHGLVTWAADPLRNLTVIASIEPSDTGDPILKTYILTPDKLIGLPLNTTIVFTGANWMNITLNGALVVDYPGSLALLTLYDNQTGYAHAYLLNYTSGGISDIYSDTTTRMYRVSASSLGTLVGGSVLNTTTGLYEARIFTFDSQTLQFQETAEYAGIGSNEETLVATVLNNTFLLGIGRSYASPDNLTLTGTDTSTAYPVPEAWITPLLMIIASTTALFIFLRKNQKQENKSLL